VLFEDGHVAGIRFRRGGVAEEIKVRREVVISAGSMQSPAVLLRSGIGPGAHLKSHGIDIVAEAPEVGQNLQEHASFALSKFVDVPTYNAMTGPLQMTGHLANYLLLRRGMLTAGPQTRMGY